MQIECFIEVRRVTFKLSTILNVNFSGNVYVKGSRTQPFLQINIKNYSPDSNQ